LMLGHTGLGSRVTALGSQEVTVEEISVVEVRVGEYLPDGRFKGK
jgi:hypothetical protein